MFPPLCLMAACAHTVIDDDGTTHVTGFVSMTIAPTDRPATFAGQVTEVRTAGLSVFDTPNGNGASLGLTRLLNGFLRNDVAVTGDPMTIE